MHNGWESENAIWRRRRIDGVASPMSSFTDVVTRSLFACNSFPGSLFPFIFQSKIPLKRDSGLAQGPADFFRSCHLPTFGSSSACHSLLPWSAPSGFCCTSIRYIYLGVDGSQLKLFMHLLGLRRKVRYGTPTNRTEQSMYIESGQCIPSGAQHSIVYEFEVCNSQSSVVTSAP